MKPSLDETIKTKQPRRNNQIVHAHEPDLGNGIKKLRVASLAIIFASRSEISTAAMQETQSRVRIPARCIVRRSMSCSKVPERMAGIYSAARVSESVRTLRHKASRNARNMLTHAIAEHAWVGQPDPEGRHPTPKFRSAILLLLPLRLAAKDAADNGQLTRKTEVE
jgi:hypothetical protein